MANFRQNIHPWLKVLQLLKSGGGGTDRDVEEVMIMMMMMLMMMLIMIMIVQAWNCIGDYYAERHKWDEAVQYYEKVKLMT